MDARSGLGRVGNLGSINISNVEGTPAKYVDTGVSIDISQQDFSISLWLKFLGNQNSAIGQVKTLLPIGSNYFIPYAALSKIFWFRTVTLGNSSIISDGEWHHLVMVWNKPAEKYKGYVDGVYIGESMAVTGYSSITNIILGCRADISMGVNSFYNGDISMVKIYQRQINANEVKLLHQGLPISRANLLLEYNLNKIIDVNGTPIIPDTSGNGNDGTVIGVVITPDKPF